MVGSAREALTFPAAPLPPKSLQPPDVPAYGAVLGISAYPNHALPKSGQIQAVEAQVGRRFDIDHNYYRWAVSIPTTDQAADAQVGRIPLISWGGPQVSQIVNGSQDQLIEQRADALRGYGRPLFLRWFWEMDQGGCDARGCGAADAAGYVLAWQRIWQLFQARGARNVAFVWCPTVGAFDRGIADQFYPDDPYVDWVGVDGYGRDPANPTPLRQIFGGFHAGWRGRKPLMICETGAANGPGQAQWIAEARRDLPSLPGIKAVCYWDSHDRVDYRITAPASLAAARAWAQDSYVNILRLPEGTAGQLDRSAARR